MQAQASTRFKTLDLIYIALFAVIIAVCSWITIPTVVPFTLQTFAIFLSVGLLGWKRGTVAVLIYILLGAIGIPVFSGFNAGLGWILGPTGGYIIGFIFTALIMGAIINKTGKKPVFLALAMFAGLLACYAFGTTWFMIVYAQNSGAIGLSSALLLCVIPFIIPDLLKITLAVILTARLAPHIKD